MSRICKNHLTDHIRDRFRANPLRVPEARIQPMCVLEIQKGRQQYLGEFRFLVRDGFEHALPVSESPVAEISDSRSRSVDFKTGFGILGGFLKALSIDPASVSASIARSRKLAFSFSNVRRRFVDVLQLGQVLSQHQLFGDTNNFVLQPAMHDKKVRLGLITDVIVSNNFSLSALSDGETTVDVDVPALADVVSQANAHVKIHKTAAEDIQFEGPDDLTFAFTCLEIRIDPATGKFSRGDWMQNIRTATGELRSFESLQPGEEMLLERILIDENTEYPLMIDL